MSVPLLPACNLQLTPPTRAALPALPDSASRISLIPCSLPVPPWAGVRPHRLAGYRGTDHARLSTATGTGPQDQLRSRSPHRDAGPKDPVPLKLSGVPCPPEVSLQVAPSLLRPYGPRAGCPSVSPALPSLPLTPSLSLPCHQACDGGMPRSVVPGHVGRDRSRAGCLGHIRPLMRAAGFSSAASQGHRMQRAWRWPEAVSRRRKDGRGRGDGTEQHGHRADRPSLTSPVSMQIGTRGDPSTGYGPGDAGDPLGRGGRLFPVQGGVLAHPGGRDRGGCLLGRAHPSPWGAKGDHPPGLSRPARPPLLTHRPLQVPGRGQDPAAGPAQKPPRREPRDAPAPQARPRGSGGHAVLAPLLLSPSSARSALRAQAPPPYAPPLPAWVDAPGQQEKHEQSLAELEAGTSPASEVPGSMGRGGERPEPPRGFGLRTAGPGRRAVLGPVSSGALRKGGRRGAPGDRGRRGQAAHAAHSRGRVLAATRGVPTVAAGLTALGAGTGSRWDPGALGRAAGVWRSSSRFCKLSGGEREADEIKIRT